MMAVDTSFKHILGNFVKRSFAAGIKKRIQEQLLNLGYNLYRITDDDRLHLASQHQSPTFAESLFDEALPRLYELRERYKAVQLPIALHSVWKSRGRTKDSADVGWGSIDVRVFRSNSAYVSSYLRSDPYISRLIYFIFADAVRRNDSAGLMATLTEDGAFGCQTCDYPGIGRVSRDKLDSVLEINFLQKHVNVLARSDLRVLDIGAGYGRMAYHMLTANPKICSYTCVDAVPESTFLSEFYLKWRGLEEKVEVVPLDELEAHFAKTPKYDLALNIHSFSECTYAAVEWWLKRIAEIGVTFLMIVPNESEELLATEPDFSKRDFLPLLNKLGYQLLAKEPVFHDPAVQGLLSVRDHMFLFKLNK
jgi:SAM-dependent methyltransferase